MEKGKISSPQLGKLLEGALIRFICDRRMMFGSPIYVFKRNMFAGVHQNNIFIHLSEPDSKLILRKYSGAAPFKPMKGHIMKNYITIPETLYGNREEFNNWLLRSYAFAASLSPKASKKKDK